MQSPPSCILPRVEQRGRIRIELIARARLESSACHFMPSPCYGEDASEASKVRVGFQRRVFLRRDYDPVLAGTPSLGEPQNQTRARSERCAYGSALPPEPTPVQRGLCNEAKSLRGDSSTPPAAGSAQNDRSGGTRSVRRPSVHRLSPAISSTAYPAAARRRSERSLCWSVFFGERLRGFLPPVFSSEPVNSMIESDAASPRRKPNLTTRV
jgi:hypothetical protein